MHLPQDLELVRVIPVRVHAVAVQTHLVVQVRSAGVAGAAHGADQLPAGINVVAAVHIDRKSVV